jgi:two-component system chemotaxis response regulator CheB
MKRALMIRVLVVEDSAVAREYLVHLFGQDPALKVVGAAKDGLEAVEQTEKLKPDIIAMDVHMPRMNGYEATRKIMERTPTPIVMMSANLSEVPFAFDALRAGALALVNKPLGLDHSNHAESVRKLLEQVKLMAEVKVVRRHARHENPVSPAPPLQTDREIRLIAIGASTGGPAAVAEILDRLNGTLPLPILVVQHIAPGFTTGLAEWLNRSTALTVKVAEEGARIRPATVYLAPNDFQMGITKDGRITLTRGPAEEGFLPSATYLFRSVAEAYGKFAIGILLTGMGRDGVSGLLRMREVGGVTFAQDEETSVIFGMPEEAIRAGAAMHVLSPARIANAISWLLAHGK